MSVFETDDRIVARPASRADRLCFELARRQGREWEVPALGLGGDETLVFESAGRILACSASMELTMAIPSWAEPLRVLEELIAPGPDRAVLGLGLWVFDDVDRATATFIHRLARSLRADELGVRHTVVRVPLPEHPALDPADVAQQIVAGAIDWPAATVPLTEGYWPVGIHERAVVMVREQRAF